MSHILKLEPSNFDFAISANSVAPTALVSEFVVLFFPASHPETYILILVQNPAFLLWFVELMITSRGIFPDFAGL